MVKNYVFGYGSLISKKSRDKTGVSGDWFEVRLRGFKRFWTDIPSFEESFLVLIKSKLSFCNGVLFELDDKSLKDFDKREREVCYKRVELNKDTIEFIEKKSQKIIDGKCWVYVWNTKRLSHKLPTIQSYVDVILDGCLELGEKFATEFMKTTYDWPKIIDDRKNPQYSRALNKPLKKRIDSLLKMRY